MIDSYFQELENRIATSPFVVTHDIEIVHLSPLTAYIEGRILFINQSQVSIFEFLRISEQRIIKERYRYHYMDKDNNLVFRYDNAPHHKEIKTFPYHKHIKTKVIDSGVVDISDILNEIVEKILMLS